MKNYNLKSICLFALILILNTLFITEGYSQAPIANGTSIYSGSLYHMDNIGLGIQSPDADFQIFRSTSNSSNDPFIRIHDESLLVTPFNTLTLKKTSFIVDSDGKVGVGTKSPSNQMDVNGNMDIIGDLNIRSCSATDFLTGECAIGAEETNIKLYSSGLIRAREILVDLGTIPDYVFKEDYELMPLNELKEFIEINGHLPNVKSEKEFDQEEGYALGMMNRKLLEKVEELTLYILDLQAQINELRD